MAKKNLRKTPRGKIVAAVRLLFLRSRERAFALRRDKYTCVKCGTKQSKAKGKEKKVQVDHIAPMEERMGKIVDMIYEVLLVDPDELQTLCVECHDEKTKNERIK